MVICCLALYEGYLSSPSLVTVHCGCDLEDIIPYILHIL